MKRIVGLALTLCMVACATPHGRMAAPAPRPSAPAASVSVAPPPPALAFTAVGTLEAHGERTEKTKLSLEALAITAKTSGDVAETLIEHVFKSDSDEVLEGTFRLRVGKDVYDATPGDMIWIPENTPLRYEGEKSTVCYAVFPVDWRQRHGIK